MQTNKIDKQIHLIASVRLISSITSGFTLFCAPIHFINNLGLDGSYVGIGIGVGGAASVAGRILGGTTADSTRFGRKSVMLAALLLMATGAFILSTAGIFPVFVAGIAMTGLGFGLFSPAADALVADLTSESKLNEAYAYNRLANWVGIGLGLTIGILLIKMTGAYLLLFASCSALYFSLLAVSLKLIKAPTKILSDTELSWKDKLHNAVQDQNLVSYLMLNIGLANNVLLVMTAIPLYLMHCIEQSTEIKSADTGVMALFLGFIILCAVSQMPVARMTANLSKSKALLIATLLWSVAYIGLFISGSSQNMTIALACMIVIVLALASSIYGPASSSFMVSIAPSDSRALYLSANSLCWGVARLVGPSLGLMMVDAGLQSAASFWLILSAVNLVIFAPGLILLNRREPARQAIRISSRV